MLSNSILVLSAQCHLESPVHMCNIQIKLSRVSTVTKFIPDLSVKAANKVSRLITMPLEKQCCGGGDDFTLCFLCDAQPHS